MKSKNQDLEETVNIQRQASIKAKEAARVAEEQSKKRAEDEATLLANEKIDRNAAERKANRIQAELD